MSIELIIEATDYLEWKQCDQSGMWKSSDGEHFYWLDSDSGGYTVEIPEDLDEITRVFKHHKAVINYIERFSEPFTVANRSRCKECNTVLTSKHRHDMVGCKCPQDDRLWIDGGTDYKRVVGNIKNHIPMGIDSTAHHGILREFVLRGGYGKDGKGEYVTTLLSEMSDDYLENLIKYIENEEEYSSKYYSVYLSEKDYRRQHNIKIEEK
jgi:hypothetical protein